VGKDGRGGRRKVKEANQWGVEGRGEKNSSGISRYCIQNTMEELQRKKKPKKRVGGNCQPICNGRTGETYTLRKITSAREERSAQDRGGRKRGSLSNELTAENTWAREVRKKVSGKGEGEQRCAVLLLETTNKVMG